MSPTHPANKNGWDGTENKKYIYRVKKSPLGGCRKLKEDFVWSTIVNLIKVYKNPVECCDHTPTNTYFRVHVFCIGFLYRMTIIYSNNLVWPQNVKMVFEQSVVNFNTNSMKSRIYCCLSCVPQNRDWTYNNFHWLFVRKWKYIFNFRFLSYIWKYYLSNNTKQYQDYGFRFKTNKELRVSI